MTEGEKHMHFIIKKQNKIASGHLERWRKEVQGGLMREKPLTLQNTTEQMEPPHPLEAYSRLEWPRLLILTWQHGGDEKTVENA